MFKGEFENKLSLTQGADFGEEAIDSLKEGHLPSWPFDEADQQTMRRFRHRLGGRVLELAKNGHAGAPYLAVFLGLEEAVPVLRSSLLSNCHFYGWEESNPQPIDDRQFPGLRADLFAIQRLSGKPAWEAVRLSQAERQEIQQRIDEAGRAGQEEIFYCSVWRQQRLFPPRDRPPNVGGALLTMHYRDYNGGFHDSGVLAMINGGNARLPTAQERCWLLGGAASVKRGEDPAAVPSVEVSIPFVQAPNEPLDRCWNPEPAKGLPAGNLVGRFGLATLQRSKEVGIRGPDPLRQRALEFLTTQTNGAFNSDAVRVELTHRRLAISTGVYDVIEVHTEADSSAPSSCEGGKCWWQDWCGPGTTPHSAVLVYRADQPDKTKPVFYEIVAPDKIDDFTGRVGLVDLITLDPDGPPWLVLYNDLCDSWNFTLVRSGPDGWQEVLTGADGSTI